MSLAELKKQLGESALVAPEKVQSRPGCATGIASFDNFLLWKGFPKGALSLIQGEVGLGSTHLWLQAAAQLTHAGKWAAWINGKESQINGAAARKLKLDKFICISAPADLRQRFWALQEVCSLCLFDLVGCDLESESLKIGQILKLKKIALRYQVALVLFSRTQKTHPFFSLAIEMTSKNLKVVRALHRPTPHLIERRELYADTLPQLAAGRNAFRRRKLSHL
jgi:hypothetical protein